jgi:phosphohistidine phosphatase
MAHLIQEEFMTLQVLIVRHAPAEERGEFASTGQSDDLRPLSHQGEEKMHQNIQGLQRIISKIDGIVYSPLIRAQQTAELLASAYPKARQKALRALAPTGSESAVLAYLQSEDDAKTIALIGHEPDLGELATWLLCGRQDYWMPFKKGGICLLEFVNGVEAGNAELRWMLKPKQLRQLSEQCN